LLLIMHKDIQFQPRQTENTISKISMTKKKTKFIRYPWTP